MSKRFYVEARASEAYPWQLFDITAGLHAGPVSIHRTKREAKTARYELKKRLRNDARRQRAWAKWRAAQEGEVVVKAEKVSNPVALEGCRRLVFDGIAWTLAGGDKGDNLCFYKPATVIKVRYESGEWLADVLFDHDTHISRGHFVSGLREVT